MKDGSEWASGYNPVASRVLKELNDWVAWLTTNGVQGYVGEVGWPNNIQPLAWNAVADRWMTAADAAGLWWTIWAAGAAWGRGGNNLSIYYGNDAITADQAARQALVAEAYYTSRRGVNMAGGAFGSPTNLNALTYNYPNRASYDYIYSRGVRLIRLGLAWERVQTTLNGGLNSTGMARLQTTVTDATAAGLDVILDVHNGSGYLFDDGTTKTSLQPDGTGMPMSYFSSFWVQLAAVFESNPKVIGWGLMNEPGMSAANWQTCSQGVVTALRSAGSTKTIFACGKGGSITGWFTNHPTPWITDPGSNTIYEAHHYFDSVQSNGGSYFGSFDSEVGYAIKAGYSSGAAPAGFGSGNFGSGLYGS